MAKMCNATFPVLVSCDNLHCHILGKKVAHNYNYLLARYCIDCTNCKFLVYFLSFFASGKCFL